MFQAEWVRVDNCSARSVLNASPPQRALKPVAPDHPDSNSIRQLTGVACKVVTPSCTSFNRREPSLLEARLSILTHAPVIRGRYNSNPEISKDNVVPASRMSPGPLGNCTAIDLRKFWSAE